MIVEILVLLKGVAGTLYGIPWDCFIITSDVIDNAQRTASMARVVWMYGTVRRH